MATKPFAVGRLDFNSIINERTEQFTGREWVLQAINKWLGDHKSSRVFLLAGDPGTGKTAIAARIAQMHLGAVTCKSTPLLSPGILDYFHFCQRGLESTLSPLTFVERLASALANRYQPYQEALKSQLSGQLVIRSDVTVHGSVAEQAEVTGTKLYIEIRNGDARPMFDQIVRRPLEMLFEQGQLQPILVMIDSLDEALTFNPENNIPVLLRLVENFPPQVRFLLTCRSRNQRIFDLVGEPALDLVTDAPPGLDEVKAYAALRLSGVPEPQRGAAAERIAAKSQGNFLYAYHVLNDLIQRDVDVGDADTRDLPDSLEGVYRSFLERGLASNMARWQDIYRPLIGAIAVARGEGLTKAQLIGITGLAEDTADDVLSICSQYLVGGEQEHPYRIYHQSFRDFLLHDSKFPVYPAERNAAIARYLEDMWGSNWATCEDHYALRYTPLHWAEAAATSDEGKRATRTQALIALTQNPKYQRRFERLIGDVPAFKEHLHRAVEVAALNPRADMLPWMIRAQKAYVGFHQDFLQAEPVMKLAEEGKLEQAEARLQLFNTIDQDWQLAARLILAWLSVERNAPAAQETCAQIEKLGSITEPLPILKNRVEAALNNLSSFPIAPLPPNPLEVAKQLVKRVSGQAFDRELLLAVNPSLLVVGQAGPQNEMIAQAGYAAALDAPILVSAAEMYVAEGTSLVDQYIDAHAGYNYVEYRNRSLWFVLAAILQHHPDQAWVKERMKRVFAVALTGAGVEFQELLPLTALGLREKATSANTRAVMDQWCSDALGRATTLQNIRGADDSWGIHKRRLTGMMEIYRLLFNDDIQVAMLLKHARELPGGFAGFQAPAFLRFADGVRACGITSPGLQLEILDEALRSAHHIQDYHFCARITARCNAMKGWHNRDLNVQALIDTINRLTASPSNPEFASVHFIQDPYQFRDTGPGVLPITSAQMAGTLEQLVEVFQQPAVEFLRLNPQFALAQQIAPGTPVQVPDPGFSPLLAVHLAARVLADSSLATRREALVRVLVPVAAVNSTALDSVLSYLLMAKLPDDPELLEEIVDVTGPVVFGDVSPSEAQIGPDATMVG